MTQTAFISGASSGIGEACAKALAKEGFRLILVARRLPLLEALAQTLRNTYNVDVHCLELDVSDAKAVEDKISSLPEDFQAIDLLINNAGLAQGLDKIHEGNLSDWDTMIDVNIKGLLYVSRFVIAGMVKRQRGHIINVGSISSHQVYSGGAVYCATKFAVKALSRAIKMDVHGSPIRVSQIDPGFVNTNYAVTRFKGNQQKADAVYEGMTPLAASDIADAIVYCATRPAHVNIAEMLILPTDQTCSHLVHRDDQEEVTHTPRKEAHESCS